MKLFYYVSMLAIVTLTSFKLKDNRQKVKDYFAVPGPIEYNKTKYNLSWSSHPSANYYKQEYTLPGEKSEKFTKMIMIEAVVGDVSLEDAVRAKMGELEERKRTDPVANYQLIKNPSTGEYLVDFVLSSAAGDKVSIVEWNAYRYVELKDNGVRKGILLFAYSKRSYGNATTNFLKSLKTDRANDINFLGSYKIPAVKISAQ